VLAALQLQELRDAGRRLGRVLQNQVLETDALHHLVVHRRQPLQDALLHRQKVLLQALHDPLHAVQNHKLLAELQILGEVY